MKVLDGLEHIQKRASLATVFYQTKTSLTASLTCYKIGLIQTQRKLH